MRGTAGLPLPLPQLVVVVAALLRGAGAAVDGGCERRCGSMEVPYPFGFSSGCTVRLGCDALAGAAWLGDARELGLVVRNVTPRSIILYLRPDCSRPFNSSVAALFSDSYAPSLANQLIVSSCSPAAQLDASGCSVTGDRIVDRLSSRCSANESISCITPEGSNTTSRRHHHRRGAPVHSVLDRSELLLSNCTGLVSSVTYNDATRQAILLGPLELDWTQEAFTCECPEGFEGDGFIDGTGCHQRRGPVFAVVATVLLILLIMAATIAASILFRCCRRRDATKQPLKAVTALFRGQLVGDELDQGAAGPRQFSYDDLAAATDNFSDDRVLGRGGFGSVYRGFLSDMNREVAGKRVSEASRQGWKEFVSEVSIISRLRHRNLVQLIGWCHGGGDKLLLVYDLMHNGSLDTHLYRPD